MSIDTVRVCSHCGGRVPGTCDGQVYAYEGRLYRHDPPQPVRVCRGTHVFRPYEGKVQVMVVFGHGDAAWYDVEAMA